MRFEPPSRLVDWTILLALGVVLATGVGTMFAGAPGDWWITSLHGVIGLLLVVPLFWKLRRERAQLDPRRWSRRTIGSILLTVVALATIATGFVWVVGGDLGVYAWTGLVIHVFLGLLLLPILLVHVVRRVHVPRRVDFEGRRTAIQVGLLAVGGVLAWRAQGAIVELLGTAGASRRYTGSRPAGGEGNDFPFTSWVADDPDPVDAEEWELRIHGAVDEERSLGLSELDAEAVDDLAATLDCTSGWYADRKWQGVRIGRLLDTAGAADDARWVSFRSLTGYRFSLPIEEAREALLATHVGGERLEHGHGFPARLVAPGRRGYQWVKWVESIEVRRTPDVGEWWAIFTSGFG